MSKSTVSNYAVYYTDGSTVPNPGYGGSGLFGYTYKLVPTSRNFKHPVHNTLFFTTSGVSPKKDEVNIEVLKIVEVIKAINNPTSTNNETELHAFLLALENAFNQEDLVSFTVFTDSNYIVSSFNENMDKWIENNWKRQDNKTIVHRQEWEKINTYKNHFAQANISVNVVWVKSHADNYCNNVADIYSAIGSNSARRQALDSTIEFNPEVLNLNMTYSEYKKSYLDKDILMFFKDLYFSSSQLDDSNYCFLSSSENQNTVGKRDTATIFASNVGYTPSIISKIKEIFRSVDREYVTTCCVKLSKLENKEIHRLTDHLDLRDLIVKTTHNSKHAYSVVRDTTPFIFENGLDYPFIVNAIGLFNRMLYCIESLGEEVIGRYKFDITEKVVSGGKISFSNKDKNLDLTDITEAKVKFKQKLLLTVGYDIPSYLALKNLEQDIKKVELILDCKTDSNFCTVYVNIETDKRNLYTVNIENKFLYIR